jgi:hypothetical protein
MLGMDRSANWKLGLFCATSPPVELPLTAPAE